MKSRIRSVAARYRWQLFALAIRLKVHDSILGNSRETLTRLLKGGKVCVPGGIKTATEAKEGTSKTGK